MDSGAITLLFSRWLSSGSSPEEGYVKNNIFYHSDLAIKFSFDDSWSLQNNPTNIILNKDDTKLVINLEELLKED